MQNLSGTEHGKANQIVVFVPGMFSPRITMWPMARRFKHQGFQTLIFPNRYLLKTPEQNARQLLSQLQSLSADQIHLLGHSLGGIVIMHVLRMNSALPVGERFANGKAILIACPVNGSELGRRLHVKPVFRRLLARCVQGGVLNGMPQELDGRQVGVISGTAQFGLAAMFFQSEQPNDGMINEDETRLGGAKDTISLPQSHGLMLFSRQCTELAMRFLQHGRFAAN